MPQSRFKLIPFTAKQIQTHTVLSRSDIELTRRAKGICSATTIRAHVIANVDLFTGLNGLGGGNVKILHIAAMVGRVEVIAIATDGVKATK